MESRRLEKGIGIASTSLLILGLIFIYLSKAFEYYNIYEINTQLFHIIFAASGIYFVVKLVMDIRGGLKLPVRIAFALIETGILVYLLIISAGKIWPYFLLAALIISTTLSLGRKFGSFVLVVIGAVTFGIPLVQGIRLGKGLDIFAQDRFLELWIIYTAQIVIWYLASIVDIQREINERIVKDQKSANEQLIDANKKIEEGYEETKELNESLEEANKRLEETNQRLNKSVAEFYTLQQISKAIATILDIDELLKFVNDVLMGVMGVNYSSIILLQNNKLQVKVTNITSEDELNNLKANVNDGILFDVVKNGKAILENKVEPDKYVFTSGRGVKSLLCIPLLSKNENYGVVLVEQKRTDAFGDGNLKFLSVIANQVSVALENVGLYQKMQKMATTDGLTKIYNRLYFHEALSKEMAKADQGKYPMSVAIFDIDNFKKFNDTYGHLFGDVVLKTISRLAKEHIRQSDIIARFGGEEFVILMPNTPISEAFELIEGLRKKVSEYHIKDDTITTSVTASFGISCYPQNGITEAEVLSAADTALYKAKESGKNCVRIHGEIKE